VETCVWLISPIVLLIVTPLFFHLITENGIIINERRKTLIFYLCGICLIGNLLFISAGSVSEWYFEESVLQSHTSKQYAMYLGLIAFLLLDVTLCYVTISIIEMFEESVDQNFAVLNWINTWQIMGRLCGYLLASLDVFEVYSLYMYYVRDI
jgi:hypothetical protein